MKHEAHCMPWQGISAAQSFTWLDLWLRPSCWMALSALQGSSHVKCTRRLWFAASALACSEMPVLAASDTIATTFCPFMNAAATHTRTLQKPAYNSSASAIEALMRIYKSCLHLQADPIGRDRSKDLAIWGAITLLCVAGHQKRHYHIAVRVMAVLKIQQLLHNAVSQLRLCLLHCRRVYLNTS